VSVSNELESLKAEMQNEEQEKRDELEQKKLEKLKIKLDTQVIPLKSTKQLGSPKDEKLKQFFNEK
jgi:hypothetical protein